jgi:4-amino-4-deoxy-L-arabinose transferase-like glycosyltransferase
MFSTSNPLKSDNRIEWLIGILCVVVYTGTLFFPLLDKDAAHHANIALHMQQTGDYFSLVDRDKDYLDKPHLLFWLSAGMFKIFGVTTIAHRLPAMLFALLSVYSVYKLTKHLSDRPTARIAAIIIATAQAFVLSIMDARMETPLTASIIFGLWQLIVYVDKRKLINIVLGTLGIAAAFSTKGWLGPVVMFISVFFYILLTRNWSVFAQWKTWLFIPLFFIFISPVLYAYYLQYDLHPEKIIRGRDNNSGVRFILWGQLFERYKGFDEGGRYSDPAFLLHTFLWAFFPWCIIAYTAVAYWLRKMFWLKEWKHPANFAVLSFTLILVALSFSKFKMPHYLIMLFPLAAIFTAFYLRQIITNVKAIKLFFPLQIVFAVLVVAVTMAINFYCFKPTNWIIYLLAAVLLSIFVWMLLNKSLQKGMKLIYISAFVSLLFNFLMNYNFFPQLLKYQAGNEMAKQMKETKMNIPDSSIMLIETHAHSFDYYLGYVHKVLPKEEFEQLYPAQSEKYFFIGKRDKDSLQLKGYRFEPIISQPDYNVAKVKLKFLNPKTRALKMDTLFLARIYKDQ